MIRIALSLTLAAALLGGCAQLSQPARQDAALSQPAQDMDGLINEYGQLARQLDALVAGPDHPKRQPGQLKDLSPQALAAENAQWQRLYDRLKAIDERGLDEQQRINLALLHYQLRDRLDSYRFQAQLMPLNSEWGFYAGLGGLKDQFRFQQDSDFDHYLTALAGVGRHMDQQIHWLRQGLAQGITQPKVVLQGLPDTIRAYMKEDDFLAPFDQLPEADPRRRQARTLVRDQVLPAFKRLLDFAEREYLPGARTSIGLSQVPKGRDWYANRVRHFTTLDMTPEQVHQLGLKEVARIRTEMEAIIAELGFDGSFKDFTHFLRTDPRFYAKTPQQLLEKAAWLAKEADALLPRYFGLLPRTPYGVAPVPAAIAPNYTTGRYSGPSRDDQPGYYWVNTYALDKRPLYVLPSLTLHEAVPGHHLQISLTREQQALPDFRRHSYISAFGEGWGLYAEYLGEEAGYYKTPYERFGRLTYEMWRACRLVVDTGMHWLGWSRQQAQDYMASNTALSLHNVRTETDRYISWPGQALSYKVGELTIKRLRRQAEQALDDDFDIRAFHDAVLANGSVPLKVLEWQVAAYIAKARGG
ncbi:DUF885 domain-containing protein [Gallaecimonas sp. GXIMD4217]|uniref:DUF885 domain-containing protein n=1 Tax=Gallaecimonas sp. GXIMD4217 TaxID=3131927 RepID=UPI00311AC266